MEVLEALEGLEGIDVEADKQASAWYQTKEEKRKKRENHCIFAIFR